MVADGSRNNPASAHASGTVTPLSPVPQDLFARRHYERVCRPPAEAETLPPWCYTSEVFYEREIERIFRRCWLCVGRHDRLAGPGDYTALELAGTGVILLRDATGAYRAFANTCRHRGMQLLDGEGHCRGIKCPYHGWYYTLSGRLSAAPEMKQTEGFDKGQYGLLPLGLEDCEGFLFVNLDPSAKPLEACLADFTEVLAPYRLLDMVTTRRRKFEVTCNWKLFIENFMEYYHLKAVHPESLELVNYHRPEPPEKVRGEFISQFGTHQGTSALIKGKGHEAFPPIQTLSGRLLGGTRYTLVYPGLIFGITTDSMWFYQCTPLAPDRTRVTMGTCFPCSTVERADFEARAAAYYERWDTGLAEDIAVVERQQRGLSSPFARSGRLSHLEELIGAFGRWIVETVAEDDGGRE